MALSPRQLEKWKRTRAKGRARFIVLRAVLPLLFAPLVLLALSRGTPPLYLLALFGLGSLICLPFAILCARELWNTNERLFHEAVGEDAEEVTPEGRSDHQQDETQDLQSISSTVPQDAERQWASLAHMTVLLFFLPILIPAALIATCLLYSVFRKKSSYISYHALQTLYLLTALAALLAVTWGASQFVPQFVPRNIVTFIVAVAASVLLMFFFFGSLFASMIAATRTKSGGDFSYWLFGRWAHAKVYGTRACDSNENRA